ncbi:exodeoxyribonuclease VII large subunit [Helicobacter jaachi]|uniref:Exodeoxyribonuclease 7 large subunit n=1 Tax=Helicobacter jaachi TaxID=1677920 RepID=A0A4U8TCV2_9HELI|nr:exodeoxyribonuclease VII large subunit [Helicobacter jaachi]TLD97809.1 exodeoxyribonuclease VII large subunit [Helicobacter jaachi]
MKAISVSELNAQIKGIMEQTFIDLCVQGEISSLKVHTSGHVYLSLKDEQSSVRAVMFKGNARALKMQLEVGQSVVVIGSISVYAPKGEYQILCKSITLAGIGELAQAYEALKNKLQAKGYFESSAKKPLPRFPKRIALITSATGAAKEDMLKIAKKRWELVHITLFNTIVQGEYAKDSITKNVALADSFFGSPEGFDVIILGRGGGSIEDMWAFNEECVADAIYHARTPIISAVGHEVDTFISDFVADKRAPTPSAAMELLLPDKFEWLRVIDEMINSFNETLQQHIVRKVEALAQVKEYFNLYNFERQYMGKKEQIEALGQLMRSAFGSILQERDTQCDYAKTSLVQLYGYKLKQYEALCAHLVENLGALNPALLSYRGFVQVSRDNKPLKLEQIELNEEFMLSNLAHSIYAKRVK